jgi:endonuclease YncB( thermonuclease family)
VEFLEALEFLQPGGRVRCARARKYQCSAPGGSVLYRAAVRLGVAALALAAAAAGQGGQEPEARPGVVKDRVKGSVNHGGGKDEWVRLAGKAKVLDARTLEFADGTRVNLGPATPEPEQQGLIDGKLYPAGQEAAGFLRALIGDRPVVCFLAGEGSVCVGCYAGDTNVGHAMVVNGWALATHSTLQPAEVIARENKRGLWRGQFVNPKDWRAGKRLPGEK